MKRVICIILTLTLLILSVTGCSSTTDPEVSTEIETEKITLVVTHVSPITHPNHTSFVKMKEIIEEKTNGQITLDIHPNSELGGEVEAIEALQAGTLDITTVSAAALTAFIKEYLACDLPFMFASPEEAYAFYDGPMGDELLQLAEQVGLVGLCWWENGFRNFFNAIRAIETPADLKGLKLRVYPSPVYIASVKALGANPIAMPSTEIYSAMQQGVIDGLENTISQTYTNGTWELQKYLTIDRHFYDPSPLFISNIAWNKLTKEQQEIVYNAAIEARDFCRQQINDSESEEIAKMEEEGLKVTMLTEDQVKAFRDATKDVYKDFVGEIGQDFLDRFNKNLDDVQKN